MDHAGHTVILDCLQPYGSQARSCAHISPSACALMTARFYGVNGDTHYELEWDNDIQKPKKTAGGKSGWAKVVSRSIGGVGLAPGTASRVHVCANNPCTAMWTISKYGAVGKPLHLQPTEWKPSVGHDAPPASDIADAPPPQPHPSSSSSSDSQVTTTATCAASGSSSSSPSSESASEPPAPADAPAAADAPTRAEAATPAEALTPPALAAPETPIHAPESSAVDEPNSSSSSSSSSSSGPASDPPSPADAPAPAEAPPPAAAASPADALAPPAPPGTPSASEAQSPPDLPVEPAGEHLPSRSTAPPLPAEPIAAVAAPSPETARALDPPLVQLSEYRVFGQLLQLARKIRTPRQYIGYSALTCFGLAFDCCPCVWEGDVRVNLINAYATSQLTRCTKRCQVDGVCCIMEHDVESERVNLMHVSEMHPLSKVNHYIAGVPMTGGVYGKDGSVYDFYSSRLALLGTVMDGDCGIDLCCLMMGRPQSTSERSRVREEPH